MSEPLPPPQTLLPHRYPLLLIDRILEHSPNFIRAAKCVSINEPYFQGHFPNLPIVPGVYLVEMMVQACAALYRLDYCRGDETPPTPGRLAAIEKARFFREVTSGDKLLIEAKLRHRVGSLARFEARIQLETIDVAQSVLTLVSSLDENVL